MFYFQNSGKKSVALNATPAEFKKWAYPYVFTECQ